MSIIKTVQQNNWEAGASVLSFRMSLSKSALNPLKSIYINNPEDLIPEVPRPRQYPC